MLKLYIQKILEKLYNLCNSKQKRLDMDYGDDSKEEFLYGTTGGTPPGLLEQNNKENEQICSISFSLTEKFDVDIEGLFPDFDKLEIEELSEIAEKYAQLILSLNKGLFSKQILKIFNAHYKKSKNTKEQLFLQNVLVFYNLLQEEVSKIYNNDSPLIRPSSVFNNK